MSKLTSNDKEDIIDSLNGDVEPTPELFPKLFPTLAKQIQEKGNLDIAALASSAVPTLEYAGKRTKAQILAQAIAGLGSAPLQVDRSFNCTEDRCTNPDEWTNLVVQGDNLQFLKTCYQNTDPLIRDKVKGNVKLIYIDPPFGTGDEYGGGDGERSYSAKIAGAEFLEGLRERLYFLREMLSEDGSIFVRIDYRFSHGIKFILDEVFGPEKFGNEITIGRVKRQLRNLTRLNISTESIFYYTAGSHPVFHNPISPRTCSYCGREKDPVWDDMTSPGLRNPPERIFFGRKLLPRSGRHFMYTQEKIDQMVGEGRIRINDEISYRDLAGEKIVGRPEYLQTEDVPVDTNWTDIKGYGFTTGYPTENNELLLERVVFMASNPGDIVMDVFAGSGTTGAVAEKLGRRWIMADFGKHAIYTQQKRLLNISDSKAVQDEKDKDGEVVTKRGDTYGHDPAPFCILSSGAYDFRGVIDLGKKPEHKEAYIKFVMALFNLTPDKSAAKKFNLVNVVGIKDGDPVEVYPIWQPRYLTDIKIDQSYLKGVMDQSGGKFKGPYHIIAPETCANVGDTEIGKAKFVIHTFPFKILDDIGRQLVLHPQPASQSSVNELVTSTAYYFKDEITINVVRTAHGLKITKFQTPILDSEGNRFKGLDGIAMLLIDNNYNPKKPFDMDHTIFAEDIEEDGSIELANLSSSVAIIAIDKHGNETKVGRVK